MSHQVVTKAEAHASFHWADEDFQPYTGPDANDPSEYVAVTYQPSDTLPSWDEIIDDRPYRVLPQEPK